MLRIQYVIAASSYRAREQRKGETLWYATRFSDRLSVARDPHVYLRERFQEVEGMNVSSNNATHPLNSKTNIKLYSTVILL